MAPPTRLLGSLACRCASTSTSPACSHASRRLLSSQSSAPQQQLEQRTSASAHAPSGPAFEYTAPLWEKPWFPPSSSRLRSGGWSGWMAASRAPVAPLPTAAQATPSPTQSEMLSKRRKERARGEELLGTYVSLGEGGQEFLRGLRRVANGFNALLRAAEEHHLPVVLAQLKADLRQIRVAREEPEPELKRAEVEVEAVEVEGADMARLVKRELRRLLDTDARETDRLATRLPALDSTFAAAHAAEPDATAQRSLALKRLWELYAASADFETRADFLPALKLIRLLAKPTAPSAQSDAKAAPPELALALKVLQKLIESGAVDTSQVAAAPSYTTRTGEPLPKDVTLQTILLRTVVSLANATEDSALALATLQDLASLRDTFRLPNSSTEQDTGEVELIEDTAHALLNDLELERATVYNPTLARTSKQLPTSSEVQSTQTVLVDLLRPWMSSEEPLPEAIDELLQLFAVQLAARERFDLLGALWQAWRRHGWQLASNQHHLLRWLGGSAPFRTYGALEDGSAPSRPLSVRVVHADLFELFAKEFDTARIGDTRTSEEKNEWIRLLCNARGASERTRRAARKAFVRWSSVPSASSAPALVLSGQTTLTLVRGSLLVPTLRKDKSQDRTQFALRVINHFIRHLTAKDSPFASFKDRRVLIPHSDLTTLASCYALLGDYTSIQQVYKRLLEQRMVPDAKDIRTLVACAVVRHPRVGKAILTFALELGVPLAEMDYARIVMHVVRMTREDAGAGVNPTQAAKAVVSIVRELGQLSPESNERLRRLATNTAHDKTNPINQVTQKGTFAEPKLTAVRAELKAFRNAVKAKGAKRVMGWRKALRLYETASVEGVRDAGSLTNLIEGLLEVDRGMVNGEKRDELRAALAELVEDHLSVEKDTVETAIPSSLLAEALIKVGLRLGDASLLRRVGEVYGPRGGVSEESVLKVRRWLAQNKGRAHELAGEGGWWKAQVGFMLEK